MSTGPLTNGQILLANGLCSRQSRKAGDAGLRPWALVEPGHEPLHIDRSSRRDMLKVRFRQTSVSSIPQPKGTYALGQRSFDTRSSFITLLPLFTPIPYPRGLQRRKLRLWVEFQAPGARVARVQNALTSQARQFCWRKRTWIYGLPVWSTRSAQLPDVLPCGQCTC